MGTGKKGEVLNPGRAVLKHGRKVNSAVALADWLLRHGDEEAAFREVLDVVAAGGSMMDLCDEILVKPGYLMAWVRGERKRNMRYEMALSDRKHIDAESVRRLWKRTMQVVPEEAPTVREQLVASEMLARHSGALQDGAGSKVEVNVGGPSLVQILERAAQLRSENVEVIPGADAP